IQSMRDVFLPCMLEIERKCGAPSDFFLVESCISSLLQQKAYKRLDAKGYTSWDLVRSSPTAFSGSGSTGPCFALFYSATNEFIFGVNNSYMNHLKLNPSSLNLSPVSTVLAPSVTFAGFGVKNDNSSRLALAGLLSRFP